MTLNEYKLYALTKKQIEYHSFNPNAKFDRHLVNSYNKSYAIQKRTYWILGW